MIFLLLITTILAPIGAQAGSRSSGRDPIWNAVLKNVPAWLEMLDEPDELYTEFKLPVLAGKLILFGAVESDTCVDSGLSAEGEANECGLQRAQVEMNDWQNQFNQAIIKTSKKGGVPPRLLKNIFAWESQFWPQTTFVNTFEYGLGHITEMGADSTLRWNAPFYDSICAASFSAETCKTDYADQAIDIRRALIGVVIQRTNPDCAECSYLLDLPLAKRSISIFSETLLANASYVNMIIKDRLHRKPAEVISYEDLWKFTLTSYNAGPGCFLNAFSDLANSHNPLVWENLIQFLEPACQGAIGYVDFVSQADDYHPENAPQQAPIPSTVIIPAIDLTPTSLTETPVVTTTVTATLPPVSTGEISPTAPITSTGTPQDGTPSPTAPTPTPPDGTPGATVTSIPPEDTPTPGITPTSPDATASPSRTPAPEDFTPTPLPTQVGVTASPTVTITQTVTPTVQPTRVPVPAPVYIDAPFAPDEIVAQADPNKLGLALQTLSDFGIDISQDINLITPLDRMVIKVAPEELLYLLAYLQNNPNFTHAEPNYLAGTDSLVNDPEFSLQENLPAIQVPMTWQLLPSLQEVVVAVIDSGISTGHPDLADRLWQNAGEVGLDKNGNDRSANAIDDDGNGYVDDWQGWNMVSASNDVNDDFGHGTHLAGIIGAAVNNSIGISGIAPNARLLPVKAIDNVGNGTYSRIAEAIVYAVDAGAQIINLGFSGSVDSGLLHSAINYAVSNNVLIVAASGNNASNTPNFPAAYPGVLSVSAVDNNGYWAPFSASGMHISLAAPGLDIYSTGTGGFYYTSSGTSQAAAHVAGVAALLAGLPEFVSFDDLRAALLGSAMDRGDPGQDNYFGFGVIQAYDALKRLQTANPPNFTGFSKQTPDSPTSEELWGRTQVVWRPITDPANSIDGAFNDLLASSTGAYGASSARNWTFTAVDDTSLNNIAAVYLDFRLYFQNWSDDVYNIQVYVPGNPACTLGWCTVMTLRPNPTLPNETLPPAALTTLSIPVTTFLNTTAKLNATQIRLSGSVAIGGVADVVTIYIDEVRLRVLDVLPPTPTPSPTPVFIPTATLPASRPGTATPSTAEPHSNFSAVGEDQCSACHRTHTSQLNSLGNQATEEQVCFSCHTAGGSGTNVQPAFTSKSNTLTRFFSHPVSNTTRIHQLEESIGASFGGANRHVECEDCHSPHASARSAIPGAVPAPAVQQEMYQSSGVEPVWTAAGAAASYTMMEVADREYQVCFKCHSSYSAAPGYIPDGYGWNGSAISPGYIANGLGKLTSTNPAQAPDSRDLSKEFNSYQVSFHPVAAQGRNTNMPAGSFVAPWSQDSILFCTDCHDNGDNSTKGPHGSPLLHLLDGTSEYITQTDPTQSCAPDGCPTIHTAGELCFKCHQYNTYASGQNPASTTQFRDGSNNLHAFHTFGSCYACHDSHGSEQDHLINFDTSVVSIYPGSTSQTAWQFDQATNTGTCYVACHDGDHGLDVQYRP